MVTATASGGPDALDVGSGLAATGRALVRIASHLAPGLHCGVAVSIGSSGALRILAFSGDAREVERALRAAVPHIGATAGPLVRVAPPGVGAPHR